MIQSFPKHISLSLADNLCIVHVENTEHSSVVVGFDDTLIPCITPQINYWGSEPSSET